MKVTQGNQSLNAIQSTHVKCFQPTVYYATIFPAIMVLKSSYDSKCHINKCLPSTAPQNYFFQWLPEQLPKPYIH